MIEYEGKYIDKTKTDFLKKNGWKRSKEPITRNGVEIDAWEDPKCRAPLLSADDATTLQIERIFALPISNVEPERLRKLKKYM